MSEKKQHKEDTVGITKKRKRLTLDKKLETIKCHEKGTCLVKIGRNNSINDLSVRTCIQSKERMKQHEMNASSYMLKTITKSQSSTMQNMERRLMAWIEDCKKKKIPLSQMVIRAKAINLYDYLEINETGTASENFIASRGWFYNFVKRMRIHNVKIQGTNTHTELFPDELKKLVETEGYTPNQIFNADETGLFWKRIPSRTSLVKKEKTQGGYIVSKDRLTLLLGGNASGDLKLKPLLVYKTQTPITLKGFTVNNLPFHWRWNKKAIMTRSIFEDWLKTCFCPEVKSYCKNKNIPFKILLLLHRAPVHPTRLTDLDENVKIYFFRPSATSTLQPMAQGVISTFKTYYLRRTFSQAIEAAAKEDSLTLNDFWKKFNIKDAIQNIYESWQEVTQHNMTVVWHNILPHSSKDNVTFTTQKKDIKEEIMQMDKDLGLTSLDCNNMNKLTDSPSSDLNNEERLVLEQQPSSKTEEEEDDFTDMTVEGISFVNLSTFVSKVDEVSNFLVNADPNLERGIKVKENLKSAIKCYRDLLEDTEKTKMV